MIHLTLEDGTPATIRRDDIRGIQSIGDGAIVFLACEPSVRVRQTANLVLALWRMGNEGRPPH